MAEKKVTPKTNYAKCTLPDLIFWDPITDLMDASNSLTYLADRLDSEDRYGEANVIRLVGMQVMEIAGYMDDNKWGAKAEG